MPAWTFDGRNRELRFVSPWFADQAVSPLIVSWFVKSDDDVTPGDELAELFWSDGSSQMLTAPGGCEGAVEATNRRIRYVALRRRPSQWALRLQT